jgi:CHAT domain-containing protein
MPRLALLSVVTVVTALCGAFDPGQARAETDPAPLSAAAVERAFLEGRARTAVEAAEAALARAEAAGDPAATATAAVGLGKAWMLAGDRVAARSVLDRAVVLAREAGADRVLAAALIDGGNLDMLDDRPGPALSAYERAALIAGQAGDARLEAIARVNRARALTRLDRHAGAREALLSVAGALETGTPSGGVRDVRLGLIRAALDLLEEMGAPDPRLDGLVYDQARRVIDAAAAADDARALSLANGYLAALYERAGRLADARRLTDRALFAGQRARAPELLYRWAWREGRLALAAGDPAAATAAWRRAVAHLESVRLDIPVEYRAGRSSFRETQGPLYTGLADLLLRRASATDDAAQRGALLREARATVERLKVAELRDYFRDPCLVSPGGGQDVPIEAISPRAAALYPILLPDRTEVILSVGGTDHQVTVPVGAAAVTATVRALRRGLETRTSRAYLGPAERLYDWLIRPLEPHLKAAGIDTLVIVPDGPLRTVPLAALYDGGGFLIERYAVVTAPGLTLIDPGASALRLAGGRADASILLAGLTEEVQGFPSLPSVNVELSGIQSLLGGDVLKDETFRAPAVEQEMRQTPFSIVHIASHADFTGAEDQGFLLTYDGRLTLDELESVIKYGRHRTEPLDLLTLSACRTAVGDDRAALGLAGVAIKAGARSALASLWYVWDDASAKLIVEFYRALREGAVTKAEALRQAQLVLLNDRRYRHPTYWAPFIIIGNWL